MTEARETSYMTPAACTDMRQVRSQIDRLDRALVALLAERQSFVERAAELKTERTRVRDEARVADVMSKVLAEAQCAGLDPAIAEAVWRALLTASIAHELAAFDRRSGTAG